MPDAWDVPSGTPRHRKPPPRRLRLELAGLPHATAAAAAAAARRARIVITTRPALGDHRRAF